VDRPWGARGLFAWSSSSRCSSCSSRVLERFGFNPVGQLPLTGGCLADRPPGRLGLSARHELLANRPRMCYRPSVCRGARVGSFCWCLTDSPPWVVDRPHGDRGPSAPGPRSVRLGCFRTAKSFASCFVLPLWDCLGFVPRVGRSVVTK
jgi:hypothetical protein